MEDDQKTTQNTPSAGVNIPVYNQPPAGQPVSQMPPQGFQPNPNVVLINTEKQANPVRKFVPGRKFLKIILGLFVIILVIALIFKVVLPFFDKDAGKATLTYWGLWEDGKVMESIISDFERQNPNIKINYSKQDIKQYRETLTTRIDNGTGPDIFTYHNTWYPMFSTSLLPFSNETISKQDFSKIFYPVAQKDLIQNGAIYGIPFSVDTLAMFINTELFKAAGASAPKTWNDFVNVARTLTVKDENGKIKTAGTAMGTFDNINHAPDILSLLFLQNGVDFNDLTTTRDRVEGALNFYTAFSVDADNIWDDTLDPSLLAFSKGNLAMYFGYSWDYFDIKKFNPQLLFQIIPVPQLSEQPINLASYWAVGVSSKTASQKEALLFIKYLYAKETQQKLYSEEEKQRDFGEPFSRVDLAQSLSENPNAYTFVLQAPSATSSYFVDSTHDNGLNQQLNTYLGNAVNSINKGDSVQTTFDTFSEGIIQVKQRYGQQ